MNKKYIFIKSYTTEEGTIPVNSEVILFRGFVYFNGGMCMPSYAKLLKSIIDDDKLHEEYLKDVTIEKNEF